MLNDLLSDAARESPDRQALSAADGRSLTFAQCHGRARRIAVGLRQVSAPRLGCVIDDPLDAMPLLAGAARAGVEPCVYPATLGEPDFEDLARRFSHPVVISDRPLRLSSAKTVPLGEIEAGAPEPEAGTGSTADARILILTTGTTGAQKGAQHTWGRLISALSKTRRDHSARWLATYNLNQFAGLQVLLHALANRATLVFPASTHARDAIDAALATGVTHVSATPTFLRLFAAALGEDEAAALALSQITLGGEAADQGLLDRLAQLFPAARICHVYAGTEFGSAISVCDGRSGLPASALEGPTGAGAELRIVDGELQIRSAAGMLAYHGSEASGEGWVKTGDLVEIRDGRIEFVGRTTEVINVGGAKVHPLPVEAAASSVEGVEMVRAYGRPNPITGNIVALDVVASPTIDETALKAEIRSACASLPRAARPRSIEFVDELETRGGKLIRSGGSSP